MVIQTAAAEILIATVLSCNLGTSKKGGGDRRGQTPTPERSRVQIIDQEEPARLTDPDIVTAYQFQCPQVVGSVALQHIHGGDQLAVGVHHDRRLVPVKPSPAALVPVAHLWAVHRSKSAIDRFKGWSQLDGVS